MTEQTLARTPSSSGAAATAHRIDAETSRIVRDQFASGRPDIGFLWELCLQVEFDRAELVDGLSAWLGPVSYTHSPSPRDAHESRIPSSA
jgi:hypothetical protein